MKPHPVKVDGSTDLKTSYLYGHLLMMSEDAQDNKAITYPMVMAILLKYVIAQGMFLINTPMIFGEIRLPQQKPYTICLDIRENIGINPRIFNFYAIARSK